jgi:hypothetical protein
MDSADQRAPSAALIRARDLDPRLVCYAYRGPYDAPCAEVVVDGTLGRAKARAQRLLAASPAHLLVEIFRGEECLARLTKAAAPRPVMPA